MSDLGSSTAAPPSGFLETSAAVGGLWRFEIELARTLAQASVAATEPAATVILARLARHAAWRAEQWFAVLPSQPGIDPATLGVLPEAAVGYLEALRGSDPISVFTRAVAPWLAASTEALEADADPVGEAPTRRAACRICADIVADQRFLVSEP